MYMGNYMKKIFFALILTMFVLHTATGCSNESGEVDQLNDKIQELMNEIDELNSQISELRNQTEIITETEKIDKLNADEPEETIDMYEYLDTYDATGENITIQGKQYDTGLRRLVLDDKVTGSDFEQLKYMVNLECLKIGSFEGTVTDISDISVLAGLTNLTVLNLGQGKFQDISALAELTNLTELSVASWMITDISAIANLTNLTSLKIVSGTTKISALAELKNLETLYLGCNFIRDMSPLTELTNLKTLTLGSNLVSDISALADLPNLETFTIEDSRTIATEKVVEIREALPNTQVILK